MYSPNHFYDLNLSSETFSESLEASIRKQYEWKKINIVRVSVESAEDFKKAITDFNNHEFKNGQIHYLGHNQWWLSRNMTDQAILELPKLEWNIEMQLFSCKTVPDENSQEITWSNQIAQKLANQMNITVYGNVGDVDFVDNSTKYFAQENSWRALKPWWIIKELSDSFENWFHKNIY